MEIKDYLPKRIRDRVVRVDVDADFDYEKIEAFNIICYAWWWNGIWRYYNKRVERNCKKNRIKIEVKIRRGDVNE